MFFNFAKELRSLLEMQVTVIPDIIGTHGMVPKGLEKGLEELVSENDSRPSKVRIC